MKLLSDLSQILVNNHYLERGMGTLLNIIIDIKKKKKAIL